MQFTIANKDNVQDKVKLEAFGDVVESDTVSCRNIRLADGRIDQARVSFNYTQRAITGIKYFQGNRFAPFGNMNGNELEWYFDDNELLGVYGYSKDGVLGNLGFIVHTTNDALCPVIEERGEQPQFESIEDESEHEQSTEEQERTDGTDPTFDDFRENLDDLDETMTDDLDL